MSIKSNASSAISTTYIQDLPGEIKSGSDGKGAGKKEEGVLKGEKGSLNARKAVGRKGSRMKLVKKTLNGGTEMTGRESHKSGGQRISQEMGV